jgi:hypothetical protein
MSKPKNNYEDYNWGELLVSGKLDKLLISDLDKYLDHHKIGPAFFYFLGSRQFKWKAKGRRRE